MSGRRAARVAGAGLMATGVLLAALLILSAAVFFGLGFFPVADTDVWGSVVLVIVLILIAVGASLPARALGAGLWRSVVISAAAVVILASVTPPLLSNAEGLFVLFYLFAFVTPACIAIAASVGNGLSFVGLGSVVAVAALAFLVPRLTGWVLLPGLTEMDSAVLQGAAMLAVGWVLLPALVGLFQHRTDEAG